MRIDRSDRKFVFVLLTASLAASVGAEETKRQEKDGDKTQDYWATVGKGALRFEERSFGEWRQILATDLSPVTRTKACQALGAFAANGYQEEAIADILKLLRHDETHSVAEAACRVMEQCGDVGLPPLLEMLAHRSPSVRFESAEAIGKYESRSAVPALITAIQDRNLGVRVKACEAFKRIISKDEMGTLAEVVVPKLVEIIKRDEAKVASQVCELLCVFGPKSAPAVPSLIKVATSESPDGSIIIVQSGVILNARIQAIHALGKIGAESERALPLLKELGEGFHLREAADKAIEEIESATESPPAFPPARE